MRKTTTRSGKLIKVDGSVKSNDLQRCTVNVGADRLVIRAVSEDGQGQSVGMPVLYGSINDRGDLFLNGAFAPHIPDFIERGFVADSHDHMSYRGLVGYPISAEEKDEGLECTLEFHSTPHAQEVRTVVSERLVANKQVGLSIGFYYIRFFLILPNQYERELPKYLKGSKDEVKALIQYAKNFTAIRVVQEARLVEYSVVTMPSEMNAQALDVRSVSTGSSLLTPEQRSKYLGSNAEEYASINVVYNLFDRLIWYCLYDVLFDTEKTLEEKTAIIAAAFDEARDISINVIVALLSTKTPEETRAAAEEVRTHAVNPELTECVEARKSFTFDRHIALTKQAVETVIQRASAVKQMRSEQGEKDVLSPRMSENLAGFRAALEAEIGKLVETLTNKSGTTEPEAASTQAEAESSATPGPNVNSLLLRHKRDIARQQGVIINV